MSPSPSVIKYNNPFELLLCAVLLLLVTDFELAIKYFETYTNFYPCYACRATHHTTENFCPGLYGSGPEFRMDLSVDRTIWPSVSMEHNENN
jgi:hypothetical protein